MKHARSNGISCVSITTMAPTITNNNIPRIIITDVLIYFEFWFSTGIHYAAAFFSTFSHSSSGSSSGV